MTRLADVLSEPSSLMDAGRAEQFYKRACVAGHAPGCRNLAIMYKHLGTAEAPGIAQGKLRNLPEMPYNRLTAMSACWTNRINLAQRGAWKNDC